MLGKFEAKQMMQVYLLEEAAKMLAEVKNNEAHKVVVSRGSVGWVITWMERMEG